MTRPKQCADMTRDARLLADGQEIAVIKRGSSQIICLQPGRHKLTAVIDWCSSADFAVKDIQENHIVVKNSFSSNVFSF